MEQTLLLNATYEPLRTPRPASLMPATSFRSAADFAGVLATAMQLRGIPHRLGGHIPVGGFDCGGFVHYVLDQHQIVSPRTVAAGSQRSSRSGDRL